MTTREPNEVEKRLLSIYRKFDKRLSDRNLVHTVLVTEESLRVIYALEEKLKRTRALTMEALDDGRYRVYFDSVQFNNYLQCMMELAGLTIDPMSGAVYDENNQMIYDGDHNA